MTTTRFNLIALVVLSATAGAGRAQSLNLERRQQLVNEISQLNAQIRSLERSIAKLQDEGDALSRDSKKLQAEARKQKEEFVVSTNLLELINEPLKTAQAKLDEADKGLKETVKKVREDLEAAPEAMAAKKAFEDATDARAAARTAALAPLPAFAEYRDAVAAEKNAEAALLKLRYAARPDRAAISRAASQLLAAQSAVAVLEQKALQDNPAYQESEARVTRTNTALIAMRASFNDKLNTHPDKVVAAKALDTAKASHLKLQTSFADATKRQTRARTIATKAQSEVDRIADRHNTLRRQLDDRERQISSALAARERKQRELASLR